MFWNFEIIHYWEARLSIDLDELRKNPLLVSFSSEQESKIQFLKFQFGQVMKRSELF